MHHLSKTLAFVAAASVPCLADRDWAVVRGQGAPHGISAADWASALNSANLTGSYRITGPDVSATFPPANDGAWNSTQFDLAIKVAASVRVPRNNNDKRQLQQLSYPIRSREEEGGDDRQLQQLTYRISRRDDDDDDDDDNDNRNRRNGDYFTGTSISLTKFNEPRSVNNGWKLCVNIFLPRLDRLARDNSQNDNGDCGVFLSSACRQKLLETSAGQFGSCGVAGVPNECKDFLEDDNDEKFGYSTNIGSGAQIFAFGSQGWGRGDRGNWGNWGNNNNRNDWNDRNGRGQSAEYAVAQRLIWPVMLTWGGGSGDAAQSRASLHCVRAKDVASGSVAPVNLKQNDDDDDDDNHHDRDGDDWGRNAAGIKVPFAGWPMILAVALAMVLYC